jgi:hypothetical protein
VVFLGGGIVQRNWMLAFGGSFTLLARIAELLGKIS